MKDHIYSCIFQIPKQPYHKACGSVNMSRNCWGFGSEWVGSSHLAILLPSCSLSITTVTMLEGWYFTLVAAWAQQDTTDLLILCIPIPRKSFLHSYFPATHRIFFPVQRSCSSVLAPPWEEKHRRQAERRWQRKLQLFFNFLLFGAVLPQCWEVGWRQSRVRPCWQAVRLLAGNTVVLLPNSVITGIEQQCHCGMLSLQYC